MDNKIILITGGAGFIGTHLAESLCRDHRLVLLDNGRRDSLSAAPHLRSHPNVRVVVADTMDKAALRPAFEGVDTVLHLAAIAGVNSYYQESLKTLQVNILGTVNVLEEAVRAKVSTLVHFSTSEVFGSHALDVSESDDCGIGPSSDRRWVYATSKLAGEHFTLRYGEQHGFAGVVVRPFNVYGPRQTGEGAISNFLSAAARGEPLTVYNDGTALRSWCYVSDMVDAVKAIVAAPQRAAGQVFNIGNPREVETTLGLARRIVRLFPGAAIQFRKVDRAEVRARVPDISRSREVLGFEPKVDLEDGLRLTKAWYLGRTATA